MLGLVIVVISIISSIYSLVNGSILISLFKEIAETARDMALPENRRQKDVLTNRFNGALALYIVFFIGSIIQFLFSIWFISVDIYKIPALIVIIYTTIVILYRLLKSSKYNVKVEKYDFSKEEDIINFKVEYKALIDSLKPKSLFLKLSIFIFLLYYIYAFIMLVYPQLFIILIALF